MKKFFETFAFGLVVLLFLAIGALIVGYNMTEEKYDVVDASTLVGDARQQTGTDSYLANMEHYQESDTAPTQNNVHANANIQRTTVELKNDDLVNQIDTLVAKYLR